MSLPKITEIYNLDDKSIDNEILRTKKELFELRLKKSTNQYFTPHSFRHLKHRLAQLLMVQNNRKLKNIENK